MGAGIAILIHLILIFILGLTIAFFSGLITLFISDKNKRKRKLFLSIFIPFQILYIYYFTALIGTMIVSEVKNVDIGFGDEWYAPLNETSQILMIDLPEQAFVKSNGETLISDVSNIQQIKEKIYGKTYDGKYFSINLTNNKLNKYINENELLKKESLKNVDLVKTMSFYEKRKEEVSGTLNIVVIIFSIIISIGIALFSCRIVLNGFKFVSKKKNYC
ncbi:hypothetical protein [Flavobacterium suncheonense]|uniref:Uncharacterized protein n=1 Tax=Flavobacterium suncheonense GH29-5 = DSM 17707 TaxID=1121899 RepID=A0A0A2LYT4_9FLAO|nr:hypothetical protein [Flavobacterium suncheonense]KGO85542.1 hypothetical protein Q764_14035 [Flavobacterium suncheonense GH29-5 = DSM 17707]